MPPALREAYYSEQPQIAHVLALAFWNDELFGGIIHPHRNEYPADSDLYWLRRLRVSWWDYTHRFIVSTATDAQGKEVVTGIAHWARLGDGGKKMECRWYDPRNLIKPVVSATERLSAVIYPNRAADPAKEDIVERTYPFLHDVWSGSRAESWYLEALGVHPDYQNQGIGRTLVQWGLDRAKKEGICASVIAADGKGRFYQRCGYDTTIGTAGSFGEGNPLASVPGGYIFFRDYQNDGKEEAKG